MTLCAAVEQRLEPIKVIFFKTCLHRLLMMKRRQVSNKGVWQFVKPLSAEHPEASKADDDRSKMTHCCFAERDDGSTCSQLLRVTRDQKRGIWLTTVALDHMRKAHPNSEFSKRQAAKKQRKESASSPAPSSSSKKGGAFAVAPTKSARQQETALASVARFFVYGEQIISRQSFDEPFFRGMVDAYWDGDAKCPQLARNGLGAWVRAEFGLFARLLKHVVALEYEAADGNPFGRALDDGGALGSSRAFGFSFVDEEFGASHAVCVGLVPVDDEAALRRVALERMGMDFESAVVVETDRAEGFFADDQRRRDGKISALAVGDSERGDDPFPEGKALLERARDVARHFSSSDQHHDDLMRVAARVPGGVASGLKLKPPSADAPRYSSSHIRRERFLTTAFRLNKALKLYYQAAESPALDDADWTALVEFESVTAVADRATALERHQNLFLGGCAAALKCRVIDELRAPALRVIDLDHVTPEPDLPRVVKPVSEFTPIGRRCLERAKREAQRRYCEDETEAVRVTDRELIATILDFRTLGCKHLTRTQRARAKSLLKTLYVEYATRAWHYQRRKRTSGAAAGAEPAPAHAPEAAHAPAPAHVPAPAGETNRKPRNDDDDDEDDLGLEVWAHVFVQVNEESPPDFDAEFETVFWKWIEQAKSINWREAFPELSKYASLDVVDHLLPLNVAKLYKTLSKKHFGYLVQLARASRGCIGTLPAESFRDRAASCADLVLARGSTLLDSEELDMLFVLRMNRAFMAHMRDKYGHLRDFEPTSWLSLTENSHPMTDSESEFDDP